MIRRAFWLRAVVAAAAMLALAAVASAATLRGAAGDASTTDKVILFAADGMRPDLVDKYVGEGAMPTYDDLIAKGVKGQNGLLQATAVVVTWIHGCIGLNYWLRVKPWFPRWRVALERCRNGRTGEWLIEWNHAAYRFRVARGVADRAPVEQRSQVLRLAV